MELALKPNWREARERLIAFWHNEIIDRPCIAVTAPRCRPRPLPPPPDYKTKWADPDFVAQSYDVAHEATYFGGESLPGTSLMIGYCFGYGAPLHFSEQTVWQEPIIHDWATPPPLELDENDWAWRQVQAVVQRCLEVARGRWFVGFPNIHQPNDHLFLLRGPERFLLDLIEHPAEIKQALRKLLDNWYFIYERLAELCAAQQEGSANWLGVWHPGRRNLTLQSDLSCMLSPAMFEEFIAPELEELAAWADGTIYHLDGPGALQHLDRLLAIKPLHAIQWTPGAGQPTGLYWLELYQRIQAARKGVVIFLDYAEVEAAVRELQPEGLFIITSAPSPAAAELLLDRARQLTKKKKSR